MRKIFLTVFVLALCGQGFLARADAFNLVDGSSVSGDIVTFDDYGVKLRTSDGTYTDRVPWAKFSQDSLKLLASNPRIQPLVEPFIEPPASARPQRPEVEVKKDKDMKCLALPPKQSFFGALLSSSVGLFSMVLIYAANIYSGFEIAVFRARPKALVMGVAAVLPIIGPIIFLSLPTQIQPVSAEELAQAEADPATFAMPGQPVVDADGVQIAGETAAVADPGKPAVQVFQRGQFTFNRRFFETKFSGYFGVVRHGAEKNQTLLVKTGGGQFVVERITRISANDVHLEVAQGGVLQEVMLPFAQIQEIQLQSKTA